MTLRRFALGPFVAVAVTLGCGDGASPGDDGSSGANSSGVSDASGGPASSTTSTGTTTEASTGPDPCATPDADGDGYDAIACGGNDCDDDDPARHPDAPDGWLYTQIVAAEDLGRPALAVADDVLHVLIVDPGQSALLHCTSGDGTTWDQEVVTLDGGFAEFVDGTPSLAIAADGTVHGALGGPAGQPPLVLRRDAQGSWSMEVLAEGAGAAAIDVVGSQLRIATGSGLLLRNDGEGWVSEVTGIGGGGSAVTLAHDADGAAHILGYNAQASTGSNVGTLYATDATGAWVTDRLVPDVAQAEWLALVVLDDGVHPVLQIVDGGLTRLRWLSPPIGAWVEDAVATFDDGPQGGMHAAVAGPSPVVAFFERPSLGVGGLRLATLTASWNTEPVALDDAVGWDPQVGAQSNGTVHLVYRQTAPSSLWHARRGDDGIDQNCDGV